MAKKQVEMCDWCEEERAGYKITKRSNKGDVLCDDCLNDWHETEIEDMYEELEEE